MRLVVDAQLPKRLARWFGTRGFDALHTLDLEQGNRTPDVEIMELACREDRVVVTKDGDFAASHLLTGRPPRLLPIPTRNMGNVELERLLERNFPAIASALQANRFVELSRDKLIVHG